MQQSIKNLPGKQNGATLVVALILLLLLSLLGATSLRNAVNTERMASAVQQKNITFQASESAAAIATADNSAIINEVIRTNAPVLDQVVDIGSDIAEATVTAVPLGSRAMLGSSMDTVAGIRVMVTSTGQLDSDPGSQTVTVHGIVQMGVAGI